VSPGVVIITSPLNMYVFSSEFAGVTVQYADQISKGKIPSIESAVVSMARRVNEDALSECTKQYRKAMETFQLPSEDDKTLDLHHQQCEKTVRTLFFKLAMIVEDENQATTQFTVTELRCFYVLFNSDSVYYKSSKIFDLLLYLNIYIVPLRDSDVLSNPSHSVVTVK